MNRAYLAAAVCFLILPSPRATCGQAAVVSLEVYSKNGVVIPGGPVTSVNAIPGDELELVFRARNWGLNAGATELKGYQAGNSYQDFFSGASGCIAPPDWKEYFEKDPNCIALPDEGAYIDDSRPDWVFAGAGTTLTTISSDQCNYRWAGSLLLDSVADSGSRKYLGSLVVVVSPNAAGTFDLQPNAGDNPGTFLRDQLDQPIEPIEFEGCTIVLPGTPCLITYDPPLGIDARQPHAIEDANDRQGWDRFTIHFSPGCGEPFGTDDEFVVTVEPLGGVAPQVVEVTREGNDVTIVFDSIIPPGKWTRVLHVPSNTDTCLGFLPGDVNNDRTTSPVDVLKIIDHLNAVQNYEMHQTDIDRSGATNPADILREIDLVNGADAFEVWNGRSLPPSPCN